jgi:predicted MPP superfamily phosphohydrolase
MIPILIFLLVDAYLSFSLLGTYFTGEWMVFWSLFSVLQLFVLGQLWLYFFFFKSEADAEIHFEKPLQKFAFFSMGMMSFLLSFTLIRDLVAGVLTLFGHGLALYGEIPSTVILVLSIVCFVIGSLIARFHVSSPRVEVLVENLPEVLKNLRIVQLSDVHLGTGPGTRHVAHMVDRALSLKPDLIVLTGDIIDGMIASIGNELKEMARLKAPHGVYFVLGNHEGYWKWQESVEAMRKIGIIPLLNEGKEIQINDETLFIAGINDPAIGHMAGEGPKVPTPPLHSRLNIALIHQPQFASSIAKMRPAYHLQLSGHTHGGQFFPWNLIVGRVYPIAKGLGKIENLWVYVNQGTGYWGPPIRLGTTGEVTELVLY